MFTGLVEGTGVVGSVRSSDHGALLVIRTGTLLEGLAEGDSISVDGVCLTAVAVMEEAFSVNVSPETMRRSNIEGFEEGTVVNLERPVRAGDRFGGHIVQGHVDATTTVVRRRDEGEFVWLDLTIPVGCAEYLVEKGSVALNGVSLTVASLDEENFGVQLIPETLEKTNLRDELRSERLNVEVDILSKYVERLLHERGVIGPRMEAARVGVQSAELIEYQGD